MRLQSQRGSGLLLAIIVVLVITLVAVGVIHFSAREMSGAYAGRRQDALVACAEAGRQLLLSKFRAVGIAPTQITPALNVSLDSGTGLGTQVLGGHYDSNVQLQQVVALPSGSMGPNPFAMQDRSNSIRGTGSDFGGTPYKVVVHCQDSSSTSNRQLEVEYTVRFGL